MRVGEWMRRSVKRYQDHALALGMTIGLSAAISVACSGADRPGGIDNDGPIGLASGPCEIGQERVCGVKLDQASGVVTCYRGVQVCEDGTWSGCQNGEVTKEPIPDLDDSRYENLSISMPAACGASNFCDPGCMYFDEDPPDITPPVGGATGMGGVPNWSAPPSTATCAHELCETGVALDPLCIPCAAQVCAVDPSCCTGNAMTDDWDDACVNLVYTECAGEPVPPNLCDYSAFGDTSVRLGNGSTGYPIIGSNGTVTPEPPANLGSIYAKGLVNIRNGAVIMGDVTTEGTVYFEAGATISGDIVSGSNVEIRNNANLAGGITAINQVTLAADAIVNGDIWSGSYIDMASGSDVMMNTRSVGNLQGQAGAVVHGNATVNSGSSITTVSVLGTQDLVGPVAVPPAVTVDLPTMSDYDRDVSASCAQAAASADYNSSATRSVLPGIYGDHTGQSGYYLTLQSGGTYVFNSLQFYAGSGIRLQGTGPWDVVVCNNAYTDTGFTVYLDATTTPPDPTDFILYSDATSGDCISIGDNSILNGMFIAPNCTIRAYNNIDMQAALWGETVYTNTGIDLLPIPSDDCEAVPLFGDSTCDGTTALYTNGATYSIGDLVHYKDNIYECTGAFCSSGGGYGGAAGYWPGEGLNWTSTWTLVGPCPADDEPNSCPVTLDLPGTPGPYEPCYSGLQCQVNSRCTEVLTDPSCEHHKCATGAPLTNTCDDCVERICDIDSTCCSAAWDSTCVAMVASVCDAECGATTAIGCAHDACEVGTALDSACHASVATVCSTLPYCCDTGTPDVWDQACIDELYIVETGSAPSGPAPGESICDYAVLGNGSAALYSTHITGNVGWYNGTLTFYESWGGAPVPTVTGDLSHANGAVSIYKATIGGDLVINGSSSTVTSSNIAGNMELPSGSSQSSNVVGGSTIIPNTTVPASPTPPTFTMTCPTGGPSNWSVSGTLAPGTYGVIQLSGNVTLQPGDYYVQEFNNYGTHTVTLPAGGGEVNIYVCSNFQMAGGSSVISPTGDPLQLHVYSANGVINLGANGVYYGIYTTGTSSGTTSVGQYATIYGMLHGYYSIVQTQTGTVIDSGGFTRDDCIDRGIDPTVTVTPCPITTPLGDTISESGTCVDNGDMHQVSPAVCADVDLAVDIACDDNITVCNHGNTTLPANEAELTFYPQAGLQFATESPNPAWVAGTCPITSAIPAGTCIDQACDPTLVDEDLTVEVGLVGGATATECSALDNWSYYVDAYSCSASAMTDVYVYDYEAVCPDDAYPSWGLLTWNTTTPGTSSITFEGRTSYDGTFVDPYIPLGTADTASMTSSCLVGSSAPGCPVDLTAQLIPMGTNNQATHMELRITLTPSGADAPTLEDWRVTYTCRVDQ